MYTLVVGVRARQVVQVYGYWIGIASICVTSIIQKVCKLDVVILWWLALVLYVRLRLTNSSNFAQNFRR